MYRLALLNAIIFVIGISGIGGTELQASYDVLIESENLLTSPQYDLVATHTFHLGSCYAIIRGIESDITDQWESRVIRIDQIDNDPNTIILVSNSQWKNLTNSSETNTILPGNRIGVIGDSLYFLDQTTDSIYRVHTTTGAIKRIVDPNDIAAVTGESNVRLLSPTAFSPSHQIAFYEETSDSLLLMEQDCSVRVLIGKNDFIQLYGKTMTNYVAGGMTYNGAGVLFWTSSHQGSSGTGGIYRRDPNGVMSQVVDELTIRKNTSSFYPFVEYNDIISGPDDYLYFYDRRADFDSIVGYNLADPNFTVVVSRSDLINGVAGEDNVNALNIYNDKLTFNLIGRVGTDIYAADLLSEPSPKDCAGAWQYHYGVLGDLNEDCQISLGDVQVLSQGWMACEDYTSCRTKWLSGIDLRMDLNGDFKIDAEDMRIVVDGWLWCNDPEDPQCEENWIITP